MRISVDGRRIRNNKVAFSNLSGIVWTGPQYTAILNRPVNCGVFVNQSLRFLKRYPNQDKNV